MATVVSSPGKVLIAGGYLVLDPAYSGVVVSTSSRFYTVVLDPSSAVSPKPNCIQVRSPQFIEATWIYNVGCSDSASGSGVSVDAGEGPSKNKFVHLAIQNTLSLVAEIKGLSTLKSQLARGLEIAIVGDNDFYSQQEELQRLNLPPTIASLSKLAPFTPTNVHIADVAKTGLGSSAALITSFCTALLVHFAVIPPAVLSDPTTPAATEAKRLAHNLAQYVHCVAQGKVGSGFDVSAAVFGSHLYTRFSPEVIQPLMQDERPPHLLAVLSPQNPQWDYKIQPFKLPPYTRILLADIHAGSNTPLLVSKVLKWRKEKAEEALAVWTAIDQLNNALANCLTRLSDLYTKDATSYAQAVKWIASLQSVQWLAALNAQPELSDCLEAFNEAHDLTEKIRGKMREMGSLSGVEIEPPQQTKLLDDSISLAGVIGGGVPGAGGYDAVWLLLCDPPEPVHDIKPLERVERLWGSQQSVTPLLAEESVAGSGLRLEDLSSVKGLAEVVKA